MVYVFLAEGFEEVEALTPVDILRRAGISVKTVGVGNKRSVCGSHGISVCADITDSQFSPDDAQAIILPGGMPGTLNLGNSLVVRNAVDVCAKNNRLICAICAAPSVLGKMGLLKGKRAVCYPGFEQELVGAELAEGIVCEDGNLITSKGAGSALDFSLAILARLAGQEKAQTVEGALMRK